MNGAVFLSMLAVEPSNRNLLLKLELVAAEMPEVTVAGGQMIPIQKFEQQREANVSVDILSNQHKQQAQDLVLERPLPGAQNSAAASE